MLGWSQKLHFLASSQITLPVVAWTIFLYAICPPPSSTVTMGTCSMLIPDTLTLSGSTLASSLRTWGTFCLMMSWLIPADATATVFFISISCGNSGNDLVVVSI